MLAKTLSATHFGLNGTVIEIEGALQRALPKIHITGLPGDVIRESRDRVTACLGAHGFDVPSSRLVIHLSPASAKKQGSQLDMAIAFAVLKAEGFLQNTDLSKTAFLGELSLDGRVNRAGGAVALLQALEGHPNVENILISADNAPEAGLLGTRKTRLVQTFAEALAFVRGSGPLPEPPALELPAIAARPSLDQVIGQSLAKRALQIALAGRHHLLLLGPPGVGKSLLAQCAPDLLPPLDKEEWVEVVKARGAHGNVELDNRHRPFRSPHHSVSGAALLGGGSGIVVPGEVTLAHTGVLFLDEFPEFRKDVIEGMREPLQNGIIHLHRIGHSLSLPASFTLIAAMNPCPCGYSLGSSRRCLCSPERVLAYRRKTSGPILDRIDLCVLLTTPRLSAPHVEGRTHRDVADSIARVWRTRLARRDLENGPLNVTAPWLALDEKSRQWIDTLTDSEELSLRARDKILKVARTIADLAGRERIQIENLQEAWGLRCPEFYKAAYS